MFGIKTRFYRKHLSTARGINAGRAGRSKKSNPYPDWSISYRNWNKGWDFGQASLYSIYLLDEMEAEILRRRYEQNWLDRQRNVPPE